MKARRTEAESKVEDTRKQNAEHAARRQASVSSRKSTGNAPAAPQA